MPADDAPNDDVMRQSYNFAPGYYGLVYRADTSDYGAGPKPSQKHDDTCTESADASFDATYSAESYDESDTRYKLQAMKWGLVPSWTKRNPDYGTVMRTINCRDDSLAENRGMWISMKKKKRCIVLCNGFYEWLKKNNGKERIPHYIKRKDGQLMCFAGLWDVVQYEGEENKNYTYTVITTEANKQMSFLHDRMPVILEPGSEQIRTWLSPKRFEWSRDLQSLLRPYEGELEIYPVNKDVGKVGNDSPTFIIPIDSKENKRNIANFFSKPGKPAQTVSQVKKEVKKEEVKETSSQVKDEVTIKSETETKDESHSTTDQKDESQDAQNVEVEDENTETHAPIDVSLLSQPDSTPANNETITQEPASSPTKVPPSTSEIESSLKRSLDKMASAPSSPERTIKQAKTESSHTPAKPTRKTHSSTSNGTVVKESPARGAPSQKITSFFGKKG